MSKKASHFWVEPDKLASKGIDFCSLEAQGLWFKVMRLLHASERYGYLSRDGKPVSDEQAARRCGIDLQKWTALVAELLDFDLLKRSGDGILYSPELIAQAEWRASEAKRQRDFQRKKRKQNTQTLEFEEPNTSNNGEYNGDITVSITDISRPNSKLKNTTISSPIGKENSGGGGSQPPTAAADSSQNQNEESQDEYFRRKKLEFPHLDVDAIFADFSAKCRSGQYPKLKMTRPQFDKWLESEHPPMVPPQVQPGNGYKNPMTGKNLK